MPKSVKCIHSATKDIGAWGTSGTCGLGLELGLELRLGLLSY